MTNCSGVCRDLESDGANCGACGQACGMREYCNGGVCTTIPDAYSYAVSASPLAFVNACEQPGATVVLRNLDDATQPLMLPFVFRFYGNATQGGWLSTNGILGFRNATISFTNSCVFNEVEMAVLAFWDDLVARNNGICSATLGVPPNRQYVVTWNDVFHIQDPVGHLSFSIVLSESSDIIDVLYGTMSGAYSAGQVATIGLADDERFALDCCNEACVSSNTGRRYTPIFR
jgi:hypothetical protein